MNYDFIFISKEGTRRREPTIPNLHAEGKEPDTEPPGELGGRPPGTLIL